MSPDLSVRSTMIAGRLTRSFRDEMGCTVLTPTMDEWLSYPIPQRYRFGWMPPIALSSSPDDKLAAFSPDLLAAVTDWLPDVALDRYLNLIEYFVASYVSKVVDDSDDEIAWALEETLRTNRSGEDDLTLLAEVNMRALDKGIVT